MKRNDTLSNYWRTLVLLLVLVLIFLVGCDKQDPVSLHDDDRGGRAELEVEPTTLAIKELGVTSGDSSTVVISNERIVTGKLLIASSEFDGPLGHRQMELAHAIFFDKTQPVTIGGDTIAYRTRAAALVLVDSMTLLPVPARLQFGLIVDSLGPQYSLVRRDGSSNPTPLYIDNHVYQWTVVGGLAVATFDASIQSPPRIHVTNPGIDREFSLREPLRFEWEGGGSVIRILISLPRPGEDPKPILQLRLRSNSGKVSFPSRILELLPRNRSTFLFTFISTNNSRIEPSGVQQENILVQATTSHTLFVRLRR